MSLLNIDHSKAQAIERVFTDLHETQEKNSALCYLLTAELARLEEQKDGSTGLALRICQVLNERLADLRELMELEASLED